MDNLIVAAEAVVPLFCLMFIGVLVKKYRLLSDEELVHMNRMVFRVTASLMASASAASVLPRLTNGFTY